MPARTRHGAVTAIFCGNATIVLNDKLLLQSIAGGPLLARAIGEMGYETMTHPGAGWSGRAFSGQDRWVARRPATGKTAAFSLLPLLATQVLKHENSSTSPARHPVRALVLLPTRILADQVARQVKPHGGDTNLRSTGGVRRHRA